MLDARSREDDPDAFLSFLFRQKSASRSLKGPVEKERKGRKETPDPILFRDVFFRERLLIKSSSFYRNHRKGRGPFP